jgi:DNA polymerase-3 subunit gamma/tau
MVGQDHVVRPLANAVKSGRIAHAYLFSGARGVGKTTVARLLAMAINCRAGLDQPPCGECDSCREIIEGHAVDVFEIDGASNRGINEIRDLRETIKYLPSRSRYKVYIIDEVHMLTKEAFNALLKTLEEPPEHVVFIFATTEAHKVLPTILSRCQRYDFKRIKLEDIVARLEQIAVWEDIKIGPMALRLLARESEGGLRDALSLFDQVLAFSGNEVTDEGVAEALGLIDRTMIAGLVKALLTSDAGTALELLDQAYNFGHDSKDFAAQVLDYFRSLVVVKVTREPEKILDLLDAELSEIRTIAAQASLETLNFHFNAWLEVQGRLHRATQPRLILEALIIRAAQVEPLRPLAELVAGLEALLKAAGPSGPGAAGGPGPPRGGSPQTPSRPGDSGPTLLSSGPALTAAEPSPPEYSAVKENTGPRTWEAFCAEAEKTSPFFCAVLTQAQVKVFTPELVELVFFQANGAALVDQERLQKMLNDFFGTRPRLVLQWEKGGLPGQKPVAPVMDASAREENKREVLSHPLVAEALEILSGELLEVIPEEE